MHSGTMDRDFTVQEYILLGKDTIWSCISISTFRGKHYQKTLWPLVRVRTIPTERPPFGDEI
jgi:hypothetical protein